MQYHFHRYSSSVQSDLLSKSIEVLPKWNTTFNECSELRESEKSLKHELSSTHPPCFQCLPGIVVACWFLTQEIVGSNILFLQKYSSNSVDSLELIQDKVD